MFQKVLLIFFAGIIFIGTRGNAQSTNSTQDDLFIDINTGISVSDNDFTSTWDGFPVGHLNLRVPFYAGQLEAGARYIRYAGFAPTTTDSDFHSIFFHLGYSFPIQITTRYSIGPTLRFGGNLMIFDEPEEFESGTHRFVTDTGESEFAYELGLRNQIHINERWYIHVIISYNRTLTEIPLSYTMISAGISYSLPQPGWLKKFIR